MTQKKDLELVLFRRWINVKQSTCDELATFGELVVQGEGIANDVFCYVCEDEVRPLGMKVNGKTAIPEGKYEIKKTWSPRFKKNMLLLMKVPGFLGIRIHSGNTSKDSEGCLLIGKWLKMEKGVPTMLIQSLSALVKLERFCDKAFDENRRVFITITKHPKHIIYKEIK